jgi:hypothetical protein
MLGEELALGVSTDLATVVADVELVVGVLLLQATSAVKLAKLRLRRIG